MQDAIIEKYHAWIDSGKLELGPNTGLGITISLDGTHTVEVIHPLTPNSAKIVVLAVKES